MQLKSLLCALACANALLIPLAQAATSGFPEAGRPVKLLVGTSSGGITDVAARLLAAEFARLSGASFVVDNRDGAGGLLAGRALAFSAPDGYTLQMGTTSSNVLAPLTAKTPPFKTEQLLPAALIGWTPMVLYVNAALPARNVPELVELLRRTPGKYAFASAGVGSTSHVSGELFKTRTGTDIIHVPYRGGAALDQAVVAGDVQIGFNALGPVMQLARAGKVRALAILSEKRSTIALDVPTATEQGFALVSRFSYYVMVPSETPATVVDAINRLARSALEAPELQRSFVSNMIEPAEPAGTEAASRSFRAELTQWREVLKAADVKLD